MKMRYFVGIGLGCIASTCIGGRASAGPGPGEGTASIYSVGNRDSRLYTGDGDWRYGFSKSECGWSYPTIVGLAVSLYSSNGHTNYFWTVEGALCATSNTVQVDYSDGVPVWFGHEDARRDRSTGDWAYRLAKAECGASEVMTGFAQQNEGINEFRCSSAYTFFVGEPLQATNCSTVDFDGNDGYDTFGPGANRGDWFRGDSKGNCGANRYVKGFAVDTQGGTTRPVRILCCGAQTYGSRVGCNADEQCYYGCQFYSGTAYGVCKGAPPVK